MNSKIQFSLIIISIILISLIVGVVVYIIYSNNDDNTPGTNNVNCSYDDSDMPKPPSTLDYNRTYCEPKRNPDITLGTSANNHGGIDDDGISYIFIREDDKYDL